MGEASSSSWPRIVFFDTVAGSQMSESEIYHHGQINSLVSHPTTNLICTGHEEGGISLYDYGANRITNGIKKAHASSISSLCFTKSGSHLVSASHDGSIKVWDLRKLPREDSDEAATCLNEISKAHQQKFDEGVQCLAMHPTMPFLASGGADQLIKIYEVFTA